MKTINLTQGQVALVDDWRYEELNQFKWHAHWNEPTQSFYATRTVGKRPFRKTIWMHRQIMNTPKGMFCDHRNNDTLNNQEYNLRNVTRSQNNMNSRLRSDNALGQRCIHLHQNRYMVEVYKDYERVFTQSFPTLDEAIVARDEALKKYHGEFAYLPK
jgi:hypothetical protein